MATTSTHRYCDHPNTKSARAACRRGVDPNLLDTLATHAIVFVRRAQEQGHINTLSLTTIEEVASAHRLPLTYYTLGRTRALIVDRCVAMAECHLLAPEMF